MPVYSPPPVVPVRASLMFGDHVVDLASRALVLTVVPSPRWARESEVISGVRAAAAAGADLVEVPADPRLLGPAAQVGELPVAARVTTASSARAALDAGAALLLVPTDSLDVIWPDGQQVEDPLGPAAALAPSISGIQELRARQLSFGADDGEVPIAFDSLHLAGTDLVAEATLALSVGARLVRTHDIRKVRRVVEVIASLLEVRK